MYLKGVHSEADTAVWLAKEGVLFSASAVVVNQYNILRPFVTIPDILAAAKMMKGLNPEVVIPGHGIPGTVKIFEDSEQYYALLLDRVGKMVREGKSLDQIKNELKMPEYDGWASKERIPSNIEEPIKRGEFYENKSRFGFVLRSLFFAGVSQLVGPRPRTAFQKDERRYLCLCGQARRIQLHDHPDAGRSRADR